MLPHSPIPKLVILCTRAFTCSTLSPEPPTCGENIPRQFREVASTQSGATAACSPVHTCDCILTRGALTCTVAFMLHEPRSCVQHPQSSCKLRDTSYQNCTHSPDNDIETCSSLVLRSIPGSHSYTSLPASTIPLPLCASACIPEPRTVCGSCGQVDKHSRVVVQTVQDENL